MAAKKPAAKKGSERFDVEIVAVFTNRDTGEVGADNTYREFNVSWAHMLDTQDGLADMVKTKVAAARTEHVT